MSGEAQLGRGRKTALTILFWVVMLLLCAALIWSLRNDERNWTSKLWDLGGVLALIIVFNTFKSWWKGRDSGRVP